MSAMKGAVWWPLAGLALCMGFAAPSAAASAADFTAWVPAGWTLTHTVIGDLDRNGQDDAVLVLQQADPAKLKPNSNFGPPELNLNPRRLVVLLQTASGYQKVLEADRFLPTEHDAENSCLADPLEEGGISIVRGLLKVDLHYWLSCGSYGVTHRAFSFRYDKPRFRLIGLDIWSFMRNSGERTDYSFNFLTGKQKITTGLNEFEESNKPKVSWKRIAGPKDFYLDEMQSNCAEEKMPAWCEL